MVEVRIRAGRHDGERGEGAIGRAEAVADVDGVIAGITELDVDQCQRGVRGSGQQRVGVVGIEDQSPTGCGAFGRCVAASL